MRVFYSHIIVVDSALTGRRAEAYTPAEFGFHTFWMEDSHRTSVSFRVKACENAHIALTPVSGSTTSAYEVSVHDW